MARVEQKANWINDEANKCFYCVDAPCMQKCPAHVNIPQFIRNLKYDNINTAREIILDANALATVCGYLCPSEDLCEGACVRAKSGTAVQIRELQRYSCEHGKVKPAAVAEDTGRSVAVIGAGPSGIAFARNVSRKGVKVDVFEKEARVGGTVLKEIPAFRIPAEAIEHDVEAASNGNIRWLLNEAVTAEQIGELAGKYDAVYVSTGLAVERDPHMTYTPCERIMNASAFLAESKAGNVKMQGSVLVLGGGDTALDVARSALKAGADSAVIAYRRSKGEMPAGDEQIFSGIEDGIGLQFLTTCREIRGTGPLTAVLSRNRLGEPDESGRRKFESIPDSEYEQDFDYVIFSFGKTADAQVRAIDKPNVFFGGDVLNGGKTIVQAVGEGVTYAKKVLEYLNIE